MNRAASGETVRETRTADYSLMLLIVASGFLSACVPMVNMDIWAHLRTGQLILERRVIPYEDWYSYTASGRPWLEMHWLFQIVMAKLHAVGGVTLLVLTKAVLQALTVAACWCAAGRGVPLWVKTAIMLLMVVCLAERSFVRPDMVTNLLLAIWLLILCKERPSKSMWLLPPLQVIWVNCHGLFVLGIVVLGAYWCDTIARAAKQRGAPESGDRQVDWRKVTGCLCVTALACLANPYTVRGALFPLTLFGKLTDDPSDEHAPLVEMLRPTWASLPYFVEVILGGVTLAALIVLYRRRQSRLFYWLLFLGFSYLAWVAIRNVTLFAMVASVVSCRSIAEGMAASTPEARPPTRRRFTLAAAVVALLFLVGVTSGHWFRLMGKRTLGLTEMPQWYIHDAAEFAGRPGMPHRAYVTDYGQAAVYIFHNSPRQRVFLDGRLEVYREETIAEFFEIEDAIWAGDPNFTHLLRDEDGELPSIIVQNIPQHFAIINSLLRSKAVRLVFADSTAAVFVDPAVAERLGLLAVDPSSLHLQEPAGLFGNIATRPRNEYYLVGGSVAYVLCATVAVIILRRRARQRRALHGRGQSGEG